MKYMHLNSSCPYAGLANVLMLQGHDTEDFLIALDIDLASHIRYDKECGTFRSGFSLQSKQWFDLYLKPKGFAYVEDFWTKDTVFENLLPGMMVGILVAPGKKHAVICSGIDPKSVTFINNKWEHTEEPETLCFTHAELAERLPEEEIAVGYIESSQAEAIDLVPHYAESLQTWTLLRNQLHEFMGHFQSSEVMRGQLNVLFRPLLLDGLTMAQLRKDQELTDKLIILQGALLNVLKQNVSARLSDHMDMTLLDNSIDLIMKHAETELNKLKKHP